MRSAIISETCDFSSTSTYKYYSQQQQQQTTTSGRFFFARGVCVASERTQSSRILLLCLVFKLCKHVWSKVPSARSLILLRIRAMLWKVLKVRRFHVALAGVCRHPTRRHPNVPRATAHLTRRDRLLVPLPRATSRHRHDQFVPTAGFTPRIVNLGRVSNRARIVFILLCGLAPSFLKRRPPRRSRRVHVVCDRQSQRCIFRVVFLL